MKRTSFLKSLLALPFIAPLIGKSESKYKGLFDRPIGNIGIKDPTRILRIEDNPLYHMKGLGGEITTGPDGTFQYWLKGNGMHIQNYQNGKPLEAIFLPHKSLEPKVWKEEDIKSGVWVYFKDHNTNFSNGFMQIGQMKTWDKMNPRYVLHDNGVLHGGYTEQDKLELAQMLTRGGFTLATRAEVIEMILNSKNFI